MIMPIFFLLFNVFMTGYAAGNPTYPLWVVLGHMALTVLFMGICAYEKRTLDR